MALYMLTRPSIVQGWLDNSHDIFSRQKLIQSMERELEALTMTISRARALMALDLYEELGTYELAGQAMSVTRARAGQLARDGREWRRHDEQVSTHSS